MLKTILFWAATIALFAACNQPSTNGTNNENSSTEGTDPQATEVKNYKKPAESVKDKCAAPTNMRELSGGMEKLFYQFTSSNEANLSVFGMANAKLTKKEVVVVVDFIQFKDMNCTGEKVRYGVGARLFLNIKKTQGGIKVTDLPKLAAGVELGRASVTYSIKVIGLTGDKVRAALPNTGDFNVEAYGKVMSAVDKIQMLASDNEEGVVVEPQIIPVSN